MYLKSFLPFLVWMKLLDRETIKADVIAGITGAVIALPQGIAFYSFFSEANIQLDFIINHLSSSECNDSEHGEVEQFINQQGNELLRRLLQGFLEQKAANEMTLNSVASHQEGALNHVRHSTSRQLNSLFGEVTVNRKGYSHRNKKSQFPLDAGSI